MQKMDGRRFALNLLIESWTLPPPPSTNSYFTEEMIPVNLNN